MRAFPRLGPTNLALISLYFAPVWGLAALRALTSPFSGFEDRAHAAAVLYVRKLFNLGLDGMMWTSHLLAGIKLVIAAGFVAYLIEFARALMLAREPNRETLDVALVLSVWGITLWASPALSLDDAALVRLYATQLLMVAGAVVVIMVERHIDQSTADKATGMATAAPSPSVSR